MVTFLPKVCVCVCVSVVDFATVLSLWVTVVSNFNHLQPGQDRESD